MKHKTYSEDYETVRISYPSKWNLACPSCGEQVKFEYSDDGKLVRTLKGTVYQIVNLYSCSNQNCEFSKVKFNPSPRFDYSNRSFGADVFSFIAEEFLNYGEKPDQILDRLTKKYCLEISIDTVRRICDDILKLKSLKIDEKTLEIVHAQKFILLGFDGQDPGSDAPSIWSFMDLISNRILATRKFESLDHGDLYRTIDEICDFYDIEVIGWVSDKQNVITKCHDTYYPEVPHQYCQYHFLRNMWNHLEVLDSNIFLPLKKAINYLYIHTTSKTNKAYFENVGKLSVREVFKEVDKDLQIMIKARNKTFKELRGIWLYEKLAEYLDKIGEAMKDKDTTFRFTKIINKTAATLRHALEEATPYYEDSCQLNESFQQIRELLGDDKTSQEHKGTKLDDLYDKIYRLAKKKEPELKLEDCRAFLPSKKKSTVQIMAEWCRLWGSYRRGLFQYYSFPKIVKTNQPLEHGFSRQKQAIFNRVAKGNVSHMVATRGEDYLRLKHCSAEELNADIVEEYSDEVVKKLRAKLKLDIKDRTKTWRTRSQQYEGINLVIGIYYQTNKEKKRGRNYVG